VKSQYFSFPRKAKNILFYLSFLLPGALLSSFFWFIAVNRTPAVCHDEFMPFIDLFPPFSHAPGMHYSACALTAEKVLYVLFAVLVANIFFLPFYLTRKIHES
jgi:hypothetical protein